MEKEQEVEYVPSSAALEPGQEQGEAEITDEGGGEDELQQAMKEAEKAVDRQKAL